MYAQLCEKFFHYSALIFVILSLTLYLQMTELSHSVISPMSFRLEYKRGSTGPTMFQRYVRIQVDINPICKQGDVADLLFAITFTLLSG
jgi:BR serine/threonine kinase